MNDYIDENMKTTDANDFMYQYDASRNYDASKDLGKITAKVLLINSQEVFWNPAELGIAEREIEKVKDGKFVLLPFGEQSRGHYTFFQAAFWQKYFADFLKEIGA